MRKKFFLLLLLVVTLLSGCWDVSEPQRMYYIHGVGIDFKDDEYEIFMQIIDFSNVAKSEQPNPNPTQAEIGRAKGKTMEEALFKLYRSIDQKVFWGHMTYLILSEEAMKSEHAVPIIDSFLRHRETRYQIWAYCTQESIEEILLITPIIDKSLTASKLSNPLNSDAQESFVEPVNLRKLIIGLNEPSHEVSIPLVTINKNWQTADQSSEETALTGVGILSKDGFKGFIKDDAARGMQWMNNKTKRGQLTFKLDGEERDYLTTTLKKIGVDIHPIVKNDQVTFEIDLKYDVTVNGFKGKISVDQIRKKTIQEVKKEIKATYEEALKKNTDIYNLSEALYREDVKTWKKLQKDRKINLTSDSISKIDVHVNKVNPGRKTFDETINE
ncbi:Ger(x)C family spore germination protein [Lysinibacillus parviboronicapiens]|uniref:Ger(x)C family spore germination protein n=1 Tax=Lysinibacillus parviboronicapiens TaxID=436516 RepID=UPI000D3B8C90|nr:Ger(x)C family spore germination protein [Lysinibacillus parviboronicapiens]